MCFKEKLRRFRHIFGVRVAIRGPNQSTVGIKTKTYAIQMHERLFTSDEFLSPGTLTGTEKTD